MIRKFYILSFIGLLSLIQFSTLSAETLSEKLASSEKIYFLKLEPTKILLQFKNYNESPERYEPTFFEDKIKPFDIVSFESSFGEMKFIYERIVDENIVEEINEEILEYISQYIDRDKIEVISPDKFKDEFAVNSVYIHPEFTNFLFIEHTNDDDFHYVSMNSFKADFSIKLYEVPLGKKKSEIVSSKGGAPVLKESFGSLGFADNVQKAKAVNALLDEYFYQLDFDFDWHFERFKKDFEKNLDRKL